MREDVSAVLKDFGVKTLGSRRALERLAEELQPDETVRYIAPANSVVTDRDAGTTVSFPAVLLITSRRTVLESSVGTSYRFEFTHDLLRSVHSAGNGLTAGKVTLATEQWSITFTCSYKKSVYGKLEAMLNDMIVDGFEAFTKKERVPDRSVPDDGYSVSDYAIIRCDGCGARYILARDRIRVCEYCRLPLGV